MSRETVKLISTLPPKAQGILRGRSPLTLMSCSVTVPITQHEVYVELHTNTVDNEWFLIPGARGGAKGNFVHVQNSTTGARAMVSVNADLSLVLTTDHGKDRILVRKEVPPH